MIGVVDGQNTFAGPRKLLYWMDIYIKYHAPKTLLFNIGASKPFHNKIKSFDSKSHHDIQ